MSTMTSTEPGTITRLTRGNKVGLGILGLLGLVDLVSSLDTGGPAPAVILVLDAVVGLVTVAGVVLAWRTGSRAALRAVVVSRVISVLASVPVFFVDDIPAVLIPVSAAFIVLTAVAIYLATRRPQG